MQKYAKLVGFTFGGWLVHSGLVAAYRQQFTSTKSKSFRAVHALEIFATMSLTLLAYSRTTTEDIPVAEVLVAVFGSLLLLDGLNVVLSEQLRDQFDAGHFLLAYTSIAAAAIAVASFEDR